MAEDKEVRPGVVTMPIAGVDAVVGMLGDLNRMLNEEGSDVNKVMYADKIIRQVRGRLDLAVENYYRRSQATLAMITELNALFEKQDSETRAWWKGWMFEHGGTARAVASWRSTVTGEPAVTNERYHAWKEALTTGNRTEETQAYFQKQVGMLERTAGKNWPVGPGVEKPSCSTSHAADATSAQSESRT